MTAETVIEEFLERYPLPSGWAKPDVFTDALTLGKLSLQLAGLSVTAPSGEIVTGSAADRDELPLERAFMELVERVAVVEANARVAPLIAMDRSTGVAVELPHERVFPTSNWPEQWIYSRSNGVGLHVTPALAEAAAGLELLERDAVLRAWRGQTLPVLAPAPGLAADLGEHYEFQAFMFPQPGVPDCQVAGVFGWPLSDQAPVVFGFGAAYSDQDGALARAQREALQRLAFLWGEPIDDSPPFVPSAAYHQECYLHRRSAERLGRWLAGGHRRLVGASTKQTKHYKLLFADLTPTHLIGKLAVVRAVSDQCDLLTFGRAPIGTLPEELWIHPIA